MFVHCWTSASWPPIASAMGSPLSPIVTNLYMEEVESRALTSLIGTAPSHWYRFVEIGTGGRSFHGTHQHCGREHKFTREDIRRLSMSSWTVLCTLKAPEYQVQQKTHPQKPIPYFRFPPPTGTEATCPQNLTSPGPEFAHQNRGKGRTEAHQDSSQNVWLFWLVL